MPPKDKKSRLSGHDGTRQRLTETESTYALDTGDLVSTITTTTSLDLSAINY